jgi:hypothetical protein
MRDLWLRLEHREGGVWHWRVRHGRRGVLVYIVRRGARAHVLNARVCVCRKILFGGV